MWYLWLQVSVDEILTMNMLESQQYVCDIELCLHLRQGVPSNQVLEEITCRMNA